MDIVEKYFTIQKYYLDVQNISSSTVSIYFHRTFGNTNFTIEEFRHFFLIDIIMFHSRRLMKDHQINFKEYEKIANLLKKNSNYFYIKSTYLNIEITPLFEELIKKRSRSVYDNFLRNLFLIYSSFFKLHLNEQIFEKYDKIFAKNKTVEIAMKMLEELN